MPTRQGGSFLKKGSTLQLPANDHVTVRIDPMNLKNRFGDVETNRRDRWHA